LEFFHDVTIRQGSAHDDRADACSSAGRVGSLMLPLVMSASGLHRAIAATLNGLAVT
jgi:hypothetical protein